MLFLDVDGTILPFGGGAPITSPERGGNPLLARLDPEQGSRLAALGCEIVWATTWMGEANEVLSPLLGFGPLPVVEWSDSDDDPRLHWKTRDLARWAAGRPFVWVDDEIGEADRAWVAAHHPAPALLQRVDPAVGLTAAGLAAIRSWLQ
ncbi:HAD domain-containing protein [Actinoplanes sp. NPDC051470]|uniref:HAD domain-containing protein n=1 Tax=unclassified Actinoplanes TaxID=2626549 RepID=UPI003434559C